MRNTLANSGILTKVKALTGNLLTDKEFIHLIQLETVADYVDSLRNKPSYRSVLCQIDESNVHRGQIEEVIGNSLYYDFIKLYTFAAPKQRQLLSFILFRYEIDILKQCLKCIMYNRNSNHLLFYKTFFDRYSKLPLSDLLQSSSIDEFITNLRGTPYFSLLSKLTEFEDIITLRDYENHLDIYYFQELWKLIEQNAKGKEQKAFFSIYGTQADLLNIIGIYRSKRFFVMEPEKIIVSIFPVHYRLKKDEITSLAKSNEISEFETILAKTYYKFLDKHFEEKALETVCFHTMNHIYKNMAAALPHSILPVFYYLFLKEQEIDKITTVLECIRYKLEPNDAIKYIDRI